MNCTTPVPDVEVPATHVISKAKAAPRLPKAYPIYYEHAKRIYHRQDNYGNWIQILETALQRHLQIQHKVAKSSCAKVIDGIQGANSISYAGPLAGYKKGIYLAGGEKILVTTSPNLIAPVKGSWAIISSILRGLLGDEEHDQLLYFKCWLKIGLEALYNNEVRPGQAIAIVGPKDCGKSFLQNIMTQVFGGRSGVPYQYMTGDTPFNKDLFGAEHLMIEDNDPKTDIKSRRALGSAIKGFTVNEDQRCHAKGRDALVLRPFWRVSITVNDEPENMMLLPPIDDSLADKLMIFKARHFTLPMPTVTASERSAIQRRITADLPAFIWHLFNETKVPRNLESRRFGVTHFHHPEIIAMLWDLDPEKRFLRLVENSFKGRTRWEGSAEDLEAELGKCGDIYEVRKVLSWNNACGTYLGRLAKKYPDKVKHLPGRADGSRHWEIILVAPHTPAAPAKWTLTPLTEEEEKIVDAVPMDECDGLGFAIGPSEIMHIDDYLKSAVKNGYDPHFAYLWAKKHHIFWDKDHIVTESYMPF
jgi:energy-coupling factor transporter ATP-binding protein EcfA2